MRTIIITLTVLSAALNGFANQERVMPFSTIRYEVDEGFGGKVAVEVKQSRQGLSACRITAFGKDVVLTKDQLSKLSSVQWNTLRVVSDAGIHGAFVSVQLERGFSSGARNQVVLLVSSAGSVEILETKQE